MSGYDVIALVVHQKERRQRAHGSIGVVLLTNKGGDEWAIMIRVDSK